MADRETRSSHHFDRRPEWQFQYECHRRGLHTFKRIQTVAWLLPYPVLPLLFVKHLPVAQATTSLREPDRQLAQSYLMLLVLIMVIIEVHSKVFVL